MSTITMVAHEATMMTAQLTEAARSQGRRTGWRDAGREFQPLRMSWAVVTGEKQNLRLQTRWVTPADDC